MMTDTPTKNGTQLLDSQSTSDAPSPDVLFDVLADPRRRYALRALGESRLPMALADLADEVATRERGKPITDVSAEAVKQVYLSLYHSHVPKLVDADIAEYTQERDLVALSAGYERVEPFLETATANE